ncbi:hypothetical protein M3B11_04270 [Brevibacterium sp. p3-SID960]|nr:hypothetical protein [Brevibacterium sp. p3-SID960]MCT1690177.1 hypothetical protein [Brevibacterium sp. p3-SID960]
MLTGIDDVDEPAEAEAAATPAGDPGEDEGLCESTRLDEDRIEGECRFGHRNESVFRTAGLSEAADATAGVRDRFVDLAADEPGVDVELVEVVDDEPDARDRVAQQMVEDTGLADAEVAGEHDDGHGGTSVRQLICRRCPHLGTSTDRVPETHSRESRMRPDRQE